MNLKQTGAKLLGVRLLGLTLILPGGAPASELAIAAASNTKFALDEIIKEFHAGHTGIRVRVTYGASGNFHAQIQNGAPFDVFLSADMEYPRRLDNAGFALESGVFLYAVGRIVVWVPGDSPVDVGMFGMRSLLAPSVQKIAVANPRHAPYGVAAIAAMKSLDVYDPAEPKLIYGENIAQTAQFVQSGNADVGVLALAFAVAPAMGDSGRYWEIPAWTHPPVEQGGIILKSTKNPAAALAFRDFLLGEQGRGVLLRFGFLPPER